MGLCGAARARHRDRLRAGLHRPEQSDLRPVRRTWYADGLHLVSAIWAAIAASTSRHACELFFKLFGVFYFADGVIGLLTGSGYLDFGIFIAAGSTCPCHALRRQCAAPRARRRRDPDRLCAGAAHACRACVDAAACARLAAFAVLVALTVIVPVAEIESGCRPRRAPTSSACEPGASGDQRAGLQAQLDKTYFTFPEWYIVYSFEDFGRFLDGGSESGFAYVGHIAGFWQSYCTINRTVRPAPNRASRPS